MFALSGAGSVTPPLKKVARPPTLSALGGATYLSMRAFCACHREHAAEYHHVPTEGTLMCHARPARLIVVFAIVCGIALVTHLDAQEKPSTAKSASSAATIVNLNTATPAQIATLPGIGEKAAQRIVEYREKNNGFKKIEEILETSRSSLIY
jgi:competence ComEA-like helix-hairpin-helix protein